MNKEIKGMFKNMQAFSFLIGMALGAAISLSLFSYLVPHGPRAIAMYRKYTANRKIELQNKQVFANLNASATQTMSHIGHDMVSMNNPYMMSSVTSEKQFLEEMTFHHEAALMMAAQVLALPSLHPETKQLAEDILKTQTSEIVRMKSWLKEWGY